MGDDVRAVAKTKQRRRASAIEGRGAIGQYRRAMADSTTGKRGRRREYSTERVQTQLRLEPEVRAAVEAYRKKNGQTLQVCLERIVVQHLVDAGFLKKISEH